MFMKLDEALLSRAQKFSDLFQRITGKTKFFLARWSLILHLLFICGAILSIFGEDLLKRPPLLFLASFLCAKSILIWGSTIHKIRKEEIVFLENGTLEFSELHDFSLRFPLAVFPLLTFFLPPMPLLCYLPWFFFIAWIYFSACIPRPPGKSKLREWLESFSQVQNQVPVTSH